VLGGEVVTRPRIIMAIVTMLTIVVAIVLIRRGGEATGAAKVTSAAEKVRAKRITEARTDERAATAVTQAIAARAVRIDAQTDAYVQSTIEDLRNALNDATHAADSTALAAAPVDRLRDSINAGVDRANRAAEAADAAP
jgi:hypothetical protein